jgi:hypothetical protein
VKEIERSQHASLQTFTNLQLRGSPAGSCENKLQIHKPAQNLLQVKNIDANVVKYSGNFNFLPNIKTDSRSHFDLLSRKTTPNREPVNL